MRATQISFEISEGILQTLNQSQEELTVPICGLVLTSLFTKI